VFLQSLPFVFLLLFVLIVSLTITMSGNNESSWLVCFRNRMLGWVRHDWTLWVNAGRKCPSIDFL
jgi:hypothetical protein